MNYIIHGDRQVILLAERDLTVISSWCFVREQLFVISNIPYPIHERLKYTFVMLLRQPHTPIQSNCSHKYASVINSYAVYRTFVNQHLH